MPEHDFNIASEIFFGSWHPGSSRSRVLRVSKMHSIAVQLLYCFEYGFRKFYNTFCLLIGGSVFSCYLGAEIAINVSDWFETTLGYSKIVV